jgi:ribosomal protein S27E
MKLKFFKRKAKEPSVDTRIIICSNCGGDVRVFNFSWTALTCSYCEVNLEKADWLLAASTDDDE